MLCADGAEIQVVKPDKFLKTSHIFSRMHVSRPSLLAYKLHLDDYGSTYRLLALLRCTHHRYTTVERAFGERTIRDL